MNLEELCALRDKLIMDDSLTTRQQTFLFGMFQDLIERYRTTSILV